MRLYNSDVIDPQRKRLDEIHSLKLTEDELKPSPPFGFAMSVFSREEDVNENLYN